MLPPFALSPSDSAARLAAAKNWLASLAVPGPVRTTLSSVVDAITDGNRRAVAAGLVSLSEVASAQLDAASAAEIRDLATELSQ